MSHFGPANLLECYRRGIFPMADSRTDAEIFLMDPDLRGIIPLDGLHVSKSLKKFIKQSDWTIRYNNDFVSTIKACAVLSPEKGRDGTWISEGLEQLYITLHDAGYAYSVEVYDKNALIGGLYGVSLASAFFGESMFSQQSNASKVALVALVKGLKAQGYNLLDTQYLTPHLASMGGVEIPRDAYHEKLSQALQANMSFPTGRISVKDLLT